MHSFVSWVRRIFWQQTSSYLRSLLCITFWRGHHHQRNHARAIIAIMWYFIYIIRDAVGGRLHLTLWRHKEWLPGLYGPLKLRCVVGDGVLWHLKAHQRDTWTGLVVYSYRLFISGFIFLLWFAFRHLAPVIFYTWIVRLVCLLGIIWQGLSKASTDHFLGVYVSLAMFIVI